MARFRIDLAYLGTKYVGWQLQPEGPSIQAMVERALKIVTGLDVRVHGSGRTDAGVHALAQTAHFDVPEDKAHIPWREALNANLPGDIRITRSRPASPDFHARFNARRKTYAYALWHEPGFVLPQRRPFVWDCGPMDLEAMDRAAQAFIGEHDFAAFRNVGADVKTTVRRVIDLRRHPGNTEFETLWRITATGFLKQMVRNIVGCLVAVGRGRVEPDQVPVLLAGRDRTLAPGSAPARGLTLERVEYDGD